MRKLCALNDVRSEIDSKIARIFPPLGKHANGKRKAHKQAPDAIRNFNAPVVKGMPQTRMSSFKSLYE